MPVRLGNAELVKAVPGGETQLLVEKNQKSLIRLQTELEETVTAPISKGQQLGTLKIYAGEQLLTTVPMIAENAVERLTFGEIFLKVLRKVCMAE